MPVAVLIGVTGFVGGHIAARHHFDVAVHRSNVSQLEGSSTDLLVCSGLPAEKWRANQEPRADWENMASLAQVLTRVRAERAVLISTVDVYQPAVDVTEDDPAQFNGAGAYGAHRAWFEAFFRSRFPHALVMRLPALFAPDVRKNLVHDLLNGRADQWSAVSPASTLQFFDVTHTWDVAQRAFSEGIDLLNITSVPVTAQQVATLFDVTLSAEGPPVHYDMRSNHASAFGGENGYLYDQQAVLAGIATLRATARTQ